MIRITDIPLEYRAGFRHARELNPTLAERYAQHLTIGDPLADAAVAAVAQYDRTSIDRLLRAGMAHDEAGLRDAPGPFRELFDRLARPPEWLDPAVLKGGCPTLRDERDALVLGLITGGLVRTASTLVSQSYFMNRRFRSRAAGILKELSRQVIGVPRPGALEPGGDAWQCAIRTRFAHAELRRAIREAGIWDELLYGAPLNHAHRGFMVCNFSAMLLRDLDRLGVRLSPDERAGYLQIWRWTGHLVGVPQSLLFGDEEEAHDFGRIAIACEPRPSATSVAIANALIVAVPTVIGLPSARERRALTRYCYRVSRALIGDELADRLGFPRLHTTGLLAYLRQQRRFTALLERLVHRSPRTGFRQARELVQ